MNLGVFTESAVEQAALVWLKAIGWRVAFGPDIAPGMLQAEEADFVKVILAQRLRDALLLKLISGELKIKNAEKFNIEAAETCKSYS